MKALSLWQPWASLIVLGIKRIETRDWQRSYRGPLAIHAAKWKPDDAAEEVWRDARELGLLPAWTPERARDLPRGYVLATCQLVEIFPSGTCACSNYLENDCPKHGPYQGIFGNLEPGRFGWVLENVDPFLWPVPAKGMQGLFDWDETLVA